MADYHTELDATIAGIEKLRSNIKKDKSVQVRSIEEKSIIKATALAWFNKQRISLISALDEKSLQTIDEQFKILLALSDKACTRTKLDVLLKNIKISLTRLRVEKITQLSTVIEKQNSNDTSPNFSILVSDKEMVSILQRRWNECVICVNMNAPLSAIVMMGGLLETLLLSRFLQYPDKSLIFKSKTIPKDKSGTTLQFKEWALKNYIDVAHEMGWISQTEKDLGEVLRDYRNYIHPFKEKSHSVKIEPKDAAILWEVTKNISKQVINFK